MTKTKIDPVGPGERLHAQRRRRFWGALAALAVAGAITGAFSGFQAARHDTDLSGVWATLPPALVIGLVIVAIIAFSLGCLAFVRASDEVEIADNLWGSTASYYVYATLFPAWFVLHKAGIVGEPRDWTIFFVTLLAGLAVYGWRKLRA